MEGILRGVRPPPLPQEAVKRVVIDHFPINSVDVSTIRELDSYDDRNYYFQGTLATGNDRVVSSSEYVLKVLNWRDSLSPRAVDGFSKMMLHLNDRGYRCPYPIPASVAGECSIYSVVLTEKQLDAYVSVDHTKHGNGREGGVSIEHTERVFNVRVLGYVPGHPMGTMKTPPSERLLYSTGQYVGGMDLVLQVYVHQPFYFLPLTYYSASNATSSMHGVPKHSVLCNCY